MNEYEFVKNNGTYTCEWIDGQERELYKIYDVWCTRNVMSGHVVYAGSFEKAYETFIRPKNTEWFIR